VQFCHRCAPLSYLYLPLSHLSPPLSYLSQKGQLTVPSKDDAAKAESRLGSRDKLVFGHDFASEHAVNVDDYLISISRLAHSAFVQ
jgi:hypothetical protein